LTRVTTYRRLMYPKKTHIAVVYESTHPTEIRSIRLSCSFTKHSFLAKARKRFLIDSFSLIQ
jgi:hypothetical protein